MLDCIEYEGIAAVDETYQSDCIKYEEVAAEEMTYQSDCIFL